MVSRRSKNVSRRCVPVNDDDNDDDVRLRGGDECAAAARRPPAANARPLARRQTLLDSRLRTGIRRCPADWTDDRRSNSTETQSAA